MKALDAKIAAVALAELQCIQQRDQANAAVDHLKAQVRRTATPGRIVVSGLMLGFATGLAKPGEKIAGAGSLLSGPLFSLVLDTVVPGVLSGVTAAVSGLNDEQDEDESGDEAEEAANPGEPATGRALPDA